jgi:hypothetical protein
MIQKMKKILTVCFLITIALQTKAQKETYDILTYNAPDKNWVKQTKNDLQLYNINDNKNKTWGQIGIYKNVASKGNIDIDFERDWQDLVAKNYTPTETPNISTVKEIDGWKIKTGSSKFIFNNANAISKLITYSGNGKVVSILFIANTANYLSTLEGVIKSIKLNANVVVNKNPVVTTNTPNNKKNTFAFTTTNFDDGWVSSVKEDWVEVSKANVKVLIHYPNAITDKYNSVLKDGDYIAWNTLVAPRYSNLKDLEWKTIQSWESITFMEGDATENSTGKQVHIVLFKKHYSNGNGRYLEFISDTKSDYEKIFGVYRNVEFGWEENVANMQFRNKFAVAATDLIGVWSANDYASLSYYYVSSGGYAGSTSTSTADQFTFMNGNNYESEHNSASGVVGNAKFFKEVFKGKVTVNNWNISLSNRFKGATDNFACQFEAIKGGRILLLNQITDGFKSSYTLVKKQAK